MQKVFKCGQSLVVSIPKNYATQLDFQRGDMVDVSCTSAGQLLITKYTRAPRGGEVVRAAISHSENHAYRNRA